MSDSKSVKAWTLGDIVDLNMGLEGKCPVAGCARFWVFDAEKLIETRGRDWVVPDELPFRCEDHGVPVKFELAMYHGEKPGN